MQTTTNTTSQPSRPAIVIVKRIGTYALYCAGLAIIIAMLGAGLVGSIQDGVLILHLLSAAPFLAFLPAMVIFGRINRKARANKQMPSPEFMALGVVLAILTSCGIMLAFFSAILFLPALIITCGATGIYVARTLMKATRVERTAR